MVKSPPPLLSFNLIKGEESAVTTSLITRKLYSEAKIHSEILMLLIEQWVGT